MIHFAESQIEDLIKIVEKYEGTKSTLLFPLKQTLNEKQKENSEYIDIFQTAADYCDDMWEEECAKYIRKTYVYPTGNCYYRNEQKIPNIDIKKKTHTEWGPTGKLPGKNPIKY